MSNQGQLLGSAVPVFNVVITAAGRVSAGENRSNHVVYAISVSQTVQSWIVFRLHDDFIAVQRSLVGLPPCPSPTSFCDLPEMVKARNQLQDWLFQIVTIPASRDSFVLQHFLCFEANICPRHFQGVEWINFETSREKATRISRQSTDNLNQTNLDEMDMDEMFSGDDDGVADGGETDEDDEFVSPSVRYKPTDEAVSREDAMQIMREEVEMVDDIGSLAQSMGASHLGRSIQFQTEMSNADLSLELKTEVTGVTVGGTNGELRRSILGRAMEQADRTEAKDCSVVDGIGDSFNQQRPTSAPRLDSFNIIKVIGKGSFGKVFLVREKQTGEMYALKVLKKDHVIKRNQVEHTRTERSVLGYVQHPFIVGMNMAFQSKDKLYFVLDYCAGGELFFHLGKLEQFEEPRARFYAAEITLALSYVHDLDIIYRDLKPENVLLDARGHVRLTDFGLSKEGISSSSSGANSFCGTPEYLAPEILNRQGHGRAVDWWSLGALLYEMLTGRPPFYCKDREKLFQKIRRGELEYPAQLSFRARDILVGLLTRDPIQRLGSGPNDAEDVQNHVFFTSVEWDKLAKGEVQPPWKPEIHGSMDTSQFDKEFTNMPIHSPRSYQRLDSSTPVDNTFAGFTYTGCQFHPPC
mmetsp:Transcript_31952/g.48873  ORF Transcript_31952/g.48873 Transcript_31952/m.48873 type:complete len:637 (-) Transcript_31952:361-2271(-)